MQFIICEGSSLIFLQHESESEVSKLLMDHRLLTYELPLTFTHRASANPTKICTMADLGYAKSLKLAAMHNVFLR